MHQYAAGGAAHQRRHVGAAVGRRQRCRVVESDAVDDAHVHVDDLEALPAVGQAGDDLRFLADVGGVPQAVGAIRGRTFGGRERLGSAVAGGDAGGQLVDHPVLHRQHPPQRPGQPQVQAGAEHRDRLAEALVDAPCIHADLAYAAEQPAAQRHHRQHRQERPPHETEGPDLAQVDAEALVQLMLQTLQGTRRPAQQVGQQAGGDQARFEAGTLRREHRQDRPAQQLQRQRRRQQAEQYRQARGQGCPWRARNRQRAASTRVPISARASCPRAGASGHCAGPWLAKRRSSTSTAKASSRQIPMARSAACPELAGGRSRRQPAATRHNASAALAASHSAACPSWARPWAMAWPRRSRSRS